MTSKSQEPRTRIGRWWIRRATLTCFKLLAGGIDLSNAPSLGKLVEQTLAKFGRVDALVNTVGGYRGGKPVHETDLADWVPQLPR